MKTDERYGKTPAKRSVPELLDLGLVVIDKPIGPSSHQVSGWVRRMLGLKKAGHVGTLDPNVSGVLPVLLGRATRAAAFLLGKDKEYVGIVRFHQDISEKEIRDLFMEFTGKITQTPPVKSAVARRPRKREIFSLEILEISGRDVLFRVGCEAGTYIRKLCSDIGEKSRKGASMLELRRTRVGKWKESDTISLYALSDALWLWQEKENESKIKDSIHPVEDTISLNQVWISDGAVEAVCSGAPLMAPGLLRTEGDVRIGDDVAVMTLKDELVAFGEAQMVPEEMVSARSGVAVKTSKVIMQKGTYPKSW